MPSIGFWRPSLSSMSYLVGTFVVSLRRRRTYCHNSLGLPIIIVDSRVQATLEW